MTGIGAALRRACVRIARGKATYALVVVALGATIGTAICALAFARLVSSEPLPYPEQDRLFVAEQVTFDQAARVQDREFSFPAAMAVHEDARNVFASSVIIDHARDIVRSHPAQPLVAVTYASPEYAELFAPPMALGRFPGTRQRKDDALPVAVLSHAAWQLLFEGRPDVLGASVRTASGIDFEIVGVTAAGFIEPAFHGPGEPTAVWLPWQFDPAIPYWGWAATADSLTVAGRLAPGVSARNAADRLSVLLDARWRAAMGVSAGTRSGWSARIELTSAQRAIAGDARRVGPMLFASTAGLMLLALFNVIHVLVARVAGRAREFSIQQALGATRGHVFRAVLADMLLLMLAAGLVALLVAAGGVALMRHYLGTLLPRLNELALGWRVVTASMLVVLAIAPVLAALAIAAIRRVAATSAIHGGRHGTAPRVSRRLRTALITSQVGVAALLIAASYGLLRDAIGVLSERSIALDHSANVFLYQSAVPPLEGAVLETALGELRRRMTELPAVAQVSQSHSPLQQFIKTSVLSTRSNVPYPVEVKRIDNEYFGLTKQALAMGRNFAVTDIDQAAPVAIVNGAFAKLLDREGGALGASLGRAGEAARTVVGVVDELAYPGQTRETPRIYVPASRAGSSFNLTFRPGALLSRQQLVEFVERASPGFGVFLYDDLERQRADTLFPRRLTAIAAMLVALVVILVSGIGLYGMLSYAIGVARAEIGARLAFGARPRHILQLLFFENLFAIACGSASGAAIALVALPHAGLAGLDVTWPDAATATLTLVSLMLLACWLSARPLLALSPAAALQDAGR